MSVNKVILVGNLGADPEIRDTASGMKVATLRLATSERAKDAKGEWADHTEWHRVVSFGKTAENIERFLAKGRQVHHGAQRAADEALDFLGTARLLAGCGFAATARMRGAGQHAVFASDPALALTAQPWRHAVGPGRGAKDMGVAELRHARAFCIAGHIGFKHDIAQLVSGAAGRAHKVCHL